jgi:Fic family protein
MGVSMTLFTAPELGTREHEVLAEVADLKERLRFQLHEPRRWFGSLRRASFARAVQGSNSIEGFDAELDDAAAVDLGEETLSASEETERALRGYRDAMTFVLQLANESSFYYGGQLLKSLHFMMTSYDLKNRPGLWRAGSIYVRNDDTGEIVYEGPDVDRVPKLMHELVVQLNAEDSSDYPVLVRAAMAHLNLVLIHPFRDGNGRMARCVQTLVLARERILEPVFCSIEEYLGRNTQAYYDVLSVVGAGSWKPKRDAVPWVRFILTAHHRQARTMLRRIKESERLWDELERLASKEGLPERCIVALYDAAIGFRIRNATYRAIYEDDEVTDGMASRDLRAMVAGGLLVPHGEKRGRYYTRSAELAALRESIIENRDPRDDSDPFAKAA